jgi:hypothetical protein
VRAAADLSSLVKTDVGAEGLAYGQGARSLCITALARRCPDKVAGLRGEAVGGRFGAAPNRLASNICKHRLTRGPRRRHRYANRAVWPSTLRQFHGLLDRPKHRFPSHVQHLNPDRIAKTHEARHRLAMLDGLQATLLGDAGIAA